MIQQTTPEGTSFAQRGGASNKQIPPYDKKHWKICNASDAYRKVTQHHILQKLLPIQRVKKSDDKKPKLIKSSKST